MNENRYKTGKYFNPFTPETSRIKDKRFIGAQLGNKYISTVCCWQKGKFTVLLWLNNSIQYYINIFLYNLRYSSIN